jgi:predicted regulator of Ras-like GTPase activity (Roadblock/LC7/MglB family)
MKKYLQTLNKTPGVLGSAYLGSGEDVVDCGEAIGGAQAVVLARRAAEAYSAWMAQSSATLDMAVFVGAEGRLVLHSAGAGVLVAFAENDAAAGLLKMRMREAACAIAALQL